MSDRKFFSGRALETAIIKGAPPIRQQKGKNVAVCQSFVRGLCLDRKEKSEEVQLHKDNKPLLYQVKGWCENRRRKRGDISLTLSLRPRLINAKCPQ